MAAFKLEIVTPEKTIYSGQVRHVQAPGSEGSFGVLSGHVPFLTSLSIGLLRIDEDGGDQVDMAVSGGFALSGGFAAAFRFVAMTVAPSVVTGMGFTFSLSLFIAVLTTCGFATLRMRSVLAPTLSFQWF